MATSITAYTKRGLPPVDRQKDAPFLLRVFYRIGGHNSLEKYNHGLEQLENELQIHTWRDATLKEIALLIQEVVEDARDVNVCFSFRLIYPNHIQLAYTNKSLGVVFNYKDGPIDSKTLADCRFVIGDYLDVAIEQQTPSHDGSYGSQFPDQPSSMAVGGFDDRQSAPLSSTQNRMRDTSPSTMDIDNEPPAAATRQRANQALGVASRTNAKRVDNASSLELYSNTGRSSKRLRGDPTTAP
ncbi:hypothetical protein H4R35_000438 [Dimargaris xerosporica]|nr:hypothetical protein H4R35_000438 [Dimargaris xerosporica]